MSDQNDGVSNQAEVTYRRRYVRVEVSATCTYSRDGQDVSKAGIVNDLGGGGIRLATDEDLPLGTVLMLRLPLPNVDRQIVVRGRIVLSFYNAETKQFFHGIAFTHIDPKDQDEIIRYVASEVQRLAAHEPAE